jgi:hypothetical protein
MWTTRVCIVSATLTLLSTPHFADAGSPAATRPAPGALTLERCLRSSLRLQDLQQDLQLLAAAPMYLKISLARDVIPYLLAEESASVVGYRHEPGTHDLGKVSGRAAVAFETLLGVPLRPGDGVRERHEMALRSLAVYRAAIQAMSDEYGIGITTSEAARKFKGRFDAVDGHESANRAGIAMLEFLAEWFPLGKTLADLERVVGRPAIRREDGRMEYAFVTAYGGYSFLFRIEAERIVHVSVGSLY